MMLRYTQNTFVDSTSPLIERETLDTTTGDRYVSVSLQNGARKLEVDQIRAAPSADLGRLQTLLETAAVIPELHFIPYYFRANRGGRGHMRVGLRRFNK